MRSSDLHLDVFIDHSELHYNGETVVFEEGRQTPAARQRYAHIKSVLEAGFLEQVYQTCGQSDFSVLSEDLKANLGIMVDSVTSEVGRGLTELAFLQLTVKAIAPDQCVRLHKGNTRTNNFSWKEGISMRRLDDSYICPFLRDKGLFKLNRYGAMMTRSLAENYPYSKLYKAEMRGAFPTWIAIVDEIETNEVDSAVALAYLMSLLINRSNRFEQLANQAVDRLNSHGRFTFNEVLEILIRFFNTTQYSARAFEVVIHGFMQAYVTLGFTELSIEPLSQMRNANKKHGNIGDIELKEGRRIYEAWDAKYGKSYLYDELGELQDKLEEYGGVSIAGFIVDSYVDLRPEIMTKKEDISIITETDVRLFTFSNWVAFKTEGIVAPEQLDDLGNEWIKAVIESFARKRLDVAPIDEPCDGWLTDLISLI